MHKTLSPLSILVLLGAGLVGCDTSEDEVYFTGSAEDLALAQEMSVELLSAKRAVELRPERTWIDELSMAHTRIQQTLNGVPVFEGQAIVHLNADGSVRGITDALKDGLDVDTTPLYDQNEAIDLAVHGWAPGWAALTDQPEAELVVLRLDRPGQPGGDHLAWKIQLDRQDGTALTSRPMVFIDAHHGAELWRYENLKTASGTSNYSGTVTIDTYSSGGSYYLENTTDNIGTYTFANTYGSLYYLTDSDDSWTEAAVREGVDAHYAADGVYDYFFNTYGRDGLDASGGPGYVSSLTGSGSVISLLVNYGTNYANAYWSGTYMVFGDGDGVTFDPLTTIDITAHEMTHGITTSEANFTYYGESGAMDESIADVFGAMVERDMNGASSDIWLLGEDCYTPSISGDALRYMNDPTADGSSRDHYSTRYTGGADSGGVHFNSGIGNLAFYLLSEGGGHPTYGGSMTGIGADAAAAIWYRGLTNYMTSSSGFSAARTAHMSAAADLYGTSSGEYAAVQDAWYMVGVGDPAPDDGGDTGGVDTADTGGGEDTDTGGGGEPVDPCADYDSAYSSSLSGTGDSEYQPDGTYYRTTSRGTHEAALVGPDDADFDLYLYKYRRGAWTQVASSTDAGSSESVSYFSGRGYYLWVVESYSGSGDYDFCLTTP